MVLVTNLVAPATEAATRPDVHVLELGENLGECALTLQRGSGVAVVEATVVCGDDLVGGLQHLGVDETLDGFGKECFVVDGLHGGLRDLQHDRPVRTLLSFVALGLGAVSQLEGRKLLGSLRLVVRRVVGEDGGTVEGAVVLREVQPALVTDSVGASATDTNTNDVSRGVEELLGKGDKLLVTHSLSKEIHRHGGNELLVADSGAIGELDGLVVGVDLGNLALLTETSVLFRKSVGNCNPDTTSTPTSGETESSIGTPVTSGLVENNIGGHGLDVGGGDTLTEPGTLHLYREPSASLSSNAHYWSIGALKYLGGGHGPDLVVVGTHEEIGDTSSHHANDPLVEVLGLGVGNTSLKSSIDHTVNALNLLLLGKHGDVVLEWVGNPLALATDVRDALVAVPVIFLRKSLVDAVVKVLVVGEDNVTSDVVELSPY